MCHPCVFLLTSGCLEISSFDSWLTTLKKTHVACHSCVKKKTSARFNYFSLTPSWKQKNTLQGGSCFKKTMWCDITAVLEKNLAVLIFCFFFNSWLETNLKSTHVVCHPRVLFKHFWHFDVAFFNSRLDFLKKRMLCVLPEFF